MFKFIWLWNLNRFRRWGLNMIGTGNVINSCVTTVNTYSHFLCYVGNYQPPEAHGLMLIPVRCVVLASRGIGGFLQRCASCIESISSAFFSLASGLFFLGNTRDMEDFEHIGDA
uniref:Uncharacterized protein n=1 Tax=Leersia perrieri TaxID=77586 RepID=A0A0D9VUE5_9ORYZ